MFLANAATRRPVAMGCLIIALIMLGLNSYRTISVENMPSIDVPVVTIMTTWAGASPEDIEKDISKKIEDAVSSVEGIKHVNSMCYENLGVNVLEFNLDVDVDVAAQNVREKLDGVLSTLPADADRPVIAKVDINATSVATVFLSGDVPVDDLYDYADNIMADRFSTVNGVGEVRLIGGSKREVWVELDRDKLAAAGLTTAEVVAAVQSGVMTLPGGRLRDGGNEYSLRFDADFTTAEEISTLEVAGANGSRRYLADLGDVRLATKEIRQRSYLNREPGIILQVIKKSDGNTVEVVRDVRKRFEEVSEALPAGMKLTWVFDDGWVVRATVDSTTSDITSAIILCALILFVFLINIRTTLIVSITMPVTVVISLYLMKLAGQTLNTSTMLAIGLSAGILVSNSIVVLENVVRRFEDVDDKWEAARIGTSQMAVSVLASAGTNVVVMLPIAMMTSMVGRFFTPFALTTLIVNIVSIFISFTLTPMLCALIMRKAAEKNKNALARFGRRWNESFERFSGRYAKGLRRVGDNRLLCGIVVIASVALFMLTMKFGTRGIGFNFMDTDDWGRIFVRCEMPSYYDLERTTEKARQIADMADGLPDLEYSMLSVGKADAIGGQASDGVYLAQLELVFKSVYERDWDINDTVAQLRETYKDFPDAIITVTLPSFIGGGSSSLQMTLSGPDLDVLTDRARMLQAEFVRHPGIADMDTTARDPKPQINVIPRRAVLSDMGITPQMLGMILRGNADGIEAADFKRGDETIDIRVKLKERPGFDQVAEYAIPGREGYSIPLDSIADIQHSTTQVMIYRLDKERTVKMLGNEVKGYPTGTLMDYMNTRAKEMGVEDGDGYRILDTGMSEMLRESVADFGEAIILSVLLTYLTLAAILESFLRPFLVSLTLPAGLIGVIWALRITGLNASIFVLLGIVMLIGVVVNAPILIVDKMGQLIAAGACRREAMYEAVQEMFRSVLMVVIASGLGMFPMAISSGIGAVNRVSIGAASVGGIIVAGFLTITSIPLIYVFFTKKATAEK